MPAIESQSDEGCRIVYRRGSTVVVTAVFFNPNVFSWLVGTATLNNPRFVHYSNPLLNVNLSGAGSQLYAIPPLGSWAFTWTLDGLPNCVTKGWITAESTPDFSQSFTPQENPPPDAHAKVWLTLEEPTQHQSIVWHEVVDWTCGMADQAVSEDQARLGIAGGLHGMTLFFYYNPASNSDFVEPLGVNKGKVNLSKFFYGGFKLPVHLLCLETAALLAILMQSQGLPTWCETVWTGQREFGIPLGFRTQPLQGIGALAYSGYAFVYHMVAKSYAGSTTVTWDAAAKYSIDLLGLSFFNIDPGWTMPLYWQTPLGGLVEGYDGMANGPVMLDPYIDAVLGIYQDNPLCDQTPIPNGVF